METVSIIDLMERAIHALRDDLIIPSVEKPKTLA